MQKKNFTHSFWQNLMVAAILNCAMLDSDTAILDSDTLLSFLRFTQKHSNYILTLTQTYLIWLKLIHSHLPWWWQPSWTLPSWIWPSWIQPAYYLLSNSLTLAKIGSHHFPKKTSLIHSDSTWWWQASWISAMLDSDTAMLDSDNLLSSLRFTLKHSHSTLTLTQTNSIWLTGWWQPSWILHCWIETSCFLLSYSLKNTLTPLWLWLKLI